MQNRNPTVSNYPAQNKLIPKSDRTGLEGVSNISALNSLLQVLFNIDIFRDHIFFLQNSSVTNISASLEFQQTFIRLFMNQQPTPSAKQIPLQMGMSLDSIAKNNDAFLYFCQITKLFSVDNIFKHLFVSRASKYIKAAHFGSISIYPSETLSNIQQLLIKAISDPVVDYLAPVLVINVERQKHDMNFLLNIPYQLNLSSLMKVTDDKEYILYACIIRSGSRPTKHFYSYICDFKNNSWYLYNDSKVRPAYINEVMIQSQGGPSIHTSAAMLFYINNSFKNQLFEMNNPLVIPNWILEKACKPPIQNYLIPSPRWKITVVQVSDITQYAEEEMEIKFSSDTYIFINNDSTVSDLYTQVSTSFKKKYSKLEIWIIMHSTPCLRLSHDYDKQYLYNIVDPNKPFHIFVEENDEARQTKPGQIHIFLYFYNYSSPIPLSFLTTLSINVNESISSLFGVANDMLESNSSFEMLAFYLIDSKSYIIPDPTLTFKDLLLNNGCIIILQPKPGSADVPLVKPKKPITCHSIYTYLTDYLPNLPSLFNIFFDAIYDSYILPIRYYSTQKLVSFPKALLYDAFSDYVIKIFNLTIDTSTETLLLYGKNSTSPLVVNKEIPIAQQLANLGVESAEICIYQIPLDLYDRYLESIRIHIKSISNNPRRSKEIDLVEFYDKHLTILDIVNDQKKIAPEIEKDFILPLDKNRQVLPENEKISYIHNPIYFYLKAPKELFVKVLLIVSDSPSKLLEVPISPNESIDTFKQRLNINSADEITFSYLNEFKKKQVITNMHTIEEFINTTIYMEASFQPQFPKNVIIRPIRNENLYSYQSQYFPGKPLPPDEPTDTNQARPESKQKDHQNKMIYLKENSLLILDQFDSNVLRPFQLQLVENEMKTCIINNPAYLMLLPFDKKQPIICFDIIMPTISSLSGITYEIYTPDELMSKYNIDAKMKKIINKSTKRTIIKLKETNPSPPPPPSSKPKDSEFFDDRDEIDEKDDDLLYDIIDDTNEDDIPIDEKEYGMGDDDAFQPSQKSIKKKKKSTNKNVTPSSSSSLVPPNISTTNPNSSFIPSKIIPKSHSSANISLVKQNRNIAASLLNFDSDPRVLEEIASPAFDITSDNAINKQILKEAICSSLFPSNPTSPTLTNKSQDSTKTQESLTLKPNAASPPPNAIEANNLSIQHSSNASALNKIVGMANIDMPTIPGSNTFASPSITTSSVYPQSSGLNANHSGDSGSLFAGTKQKAPCIANSGPQTVSSAMASTNEFLPHSKDPLIAFSRPNNLIPTQQPSGSYRLPIMIRTTANSHLEFPTPPFMPSIVMLSPIHEHELSRLKVENQKSQPVKGK